MEKNKIRTGTVPGIVLGIFAMVAAVLYVITGLTTKDKSGEENSTTPAPLSAETLSSRLTPWLVGELQNIALMDAPQPLRDQKILLADGSEMPLSAMKGKALLINFWASWCAPCRAEMKELATLRKELRDYSFDVIAINADIGGLNVAQKTLNEWGVEGLDLYADPSLESVQFYAPRGLPTSLIVDLEGRIIARYLGPLAWDKENSLRFFKALSKGEV